jgi:hypothetical protein
MPKAKPIKIEAYECPKCKAIIKGTYEEAQKHVNIPINRPLPTGFTFISPVGFVEIILGKGRISAGERRVGDFGSEYTHTYIQPTFMYAPGRSRETFEESQEYPSESIRKWFKNGDSLFLSQEQFKITKRRYKQLKDLDNNSPLKFKRTNKSLERLTNSKD